MPDSAISLTLMPHDFRSGAFDCGNPGINEALRGPLLRAIAERRSRAYYVEGEAGACLGFIALRAESFTVDSIDRGDFALTSPEVPGVLLELVGVDKSAQGQGLGKALVLAALELTTQAGALIGVRFLVLDSLPERVSFYEGMGFRRTYYQREKDTVLMVFDLQEA